MLSKYDIVNCLAEKFDFRSVLEISTPTTGASFRALSNNSHYNRCDRLVYNCDSWFSDGFPVSYQTHDIFSNSIVSAIHTMNGSSPLYDIIFVDSFHSYQSSILDLYSALLLLKTGGMIVVHDCNPLSAKIAQPEVRDDEWCGVSYQAFIDFRLAHPDFLSFTVDTDYGVGVIQKVSGSAEWCADDQLELGWRAAVSGRSGPYNFFHKNRQVLLGLISSSSFLEKFGPEPGDHLVRLQQLSASDGAPAVDVAALSVPTPTPTAAWEVVTVALDDDQTSAVIASSVMGLARQVAPSAWPGRVPAVTFLAPSAQLGVHPPEHGLTATVIPAELPSGITRVAGQVATVHPEATVLEYALVVAPDSASALAALGSTARPPSGSGWIAVPPNTPTSIVAEMTVPASPADRIYLATRVPPEGSVSYAWATWSALTIFRDPPPIAVAVPAPVAKSRRNGRRG